MGFADIDRKWRLLIIFILYLILLYLVYLFVDSMVLPQITSGDATISVPNVIKQPVANATNLLEARGLNVEITKEVFSATVNKGEIVNQRPLAGSIVKNGRYIYVTVSKGKELVNVPHLSGLSLRTAKINLMKVGLDIGDISYDTSSFIGKDLVISQSMRPGSKIAYGEHINVIISNGVENQTKIPSLIGLSLSDAKFIIQESGFLLGTVEFRSDDTYLPDVVVGQFPHPGEIANPASLVNVIITK